MTEQMPLADFHRANGAVFARCDGGIRVANFGNPPGEYRAVRTGVGLLDFSHRSLLQFTGPDRVSFLQGMLSNDVKALKPFAGQYTALLTQQGKVIADARVLCSLNSIYLDCWDTLKSKVIEHLNHYLVADEVEIADRSADYGMLSLQGPKAEPLLREMSPSSELPVQAKHHTMITIESASICVVSDSDTGEAGYDLIIPGPHLLTIAKRLTETGKRFGAAWVGEETHNMLRIEAGVPRYGSDFSEENLLLEAGLKDAVSFTKGCYLGQEVVERIRSRGHVNRQLVGLLLEGSVIPSNGDAILAASTVIGQITSATLSPALARTIALGYLQKDFWAAGTTVSVKHDADHIATTVAALPFVTARSFS